MILLMDIKPYDNFFFISLFFFLYFIYLWERACYGSHLVTLISASGFIVIFIQVNPQLSSFLIINRKESIAQNEQDPW